MYCRHCCYSLDQLSTLGCRGDKVVASWLSYNACYVKLRFGMLRFPFQMFLFCSAALFFFQTDFEKPYSCLFFSFISDCYDSCVLFRLILRDGVCASLGDFVRICSFVDGVMLLYRHFWSVCISFFYWPFLTALSVLCGWAYFHVFLVSVKILSRC